MEVDEESMSDDSLFNHNSNVYSQNVGEDDDKLSTFSYLSKGSLSQPQYRETLISLTGKRRGEEALEESVFGIYNEKKQSDKFTPSQFNSSYSQLTP